MNIDEKWMRLALKEAKKADMVDEVPIGAIIVYKDKVIARAHNKKESSKLATAHAELLAIEKACKKIGDWRLNECTLYTTIEPCVMCAGAIIQSRVGAIVYGAPDNKFGAIESVVKIFDKEGWNHYPTIRKNILSEECSKLITDFFLKKRVNK